MELRGKEISSSRSLGSERKEKEAIERCQESANHSDTDTEETGK